MSDHDDRLPMLQMLEHASEALELIRGRPRAEMQTNRVLQLALAHLVLVVGEAATRVSSAVRVQHPEIPWAKAIAARNFLAHGYDRTDYEVVWDTIAEHFPALVTALERALGRNLTDARQSHVRPGLRQATGGPRRRRPAQALVH